MKLGTQTGSVVNHVLSRAVIGQPKPNEGMGCTILSWTDRYPATVIHVNGMENLIYVQQDRAKRTDSNGMSECQQYEYTRDLNGRVFTFRKNKNGMWDEVQINQKTGRFNKTNGYGLRLGDREKYHDFSF